MRVGVTGAAGFVGQWLLTELETAGHIPIGIDRLPTDDPRTLPGDLLIPGAVTRWLENTNPDVVVHLAAQVGRVFGEDDVRRTIRLNAEMTTVLAKACGDAGIRLVYASTSEIYGDHSDDWYDEDADWVLPYNLYGLTKRWGEEVCRLYAPDGLVVVRLSMPYGPGTPPGRGRRAMDTMLWQATHHRPIIVHRGAERSWCWVGDTVRGIRMTLEQPEAEVFNVGRDDDPRSMLEIAQMACELAGASEDLITEVDSPENQIAVKRLEMTRLRRLGWAPTVELQEGMARVYDWVRLFNGDGVRVPASR